MTGSSYCRRFVLFSLVAIASPKDGSSFVVLPTPTNHALHRSEIIGAPCGPRYTSPSPEDESRTNVDAMKAMLESSWNAGAMGVVPTSPESAAEAASKSIGSALKRGKSVLLVDLRLPAFDISQGYNIYDEVLSVEFCAALAQSLQSQQLARKSLILVKDGSIVRSVSRILQIKDRHRMEEEAEAALNEGEDDEGKDKEEDADNFNESGTAEAGSSASDDIDTFRQQLISGWDEKSDSAEESQVPAEQKKSKSSAARFRKKKKPTVVYQPLASSKVYRLGSMFGDDDIASGADMFTDAVEAVDTHGSMDTSEDALIILSPVSREETVAVRRLVARYGNKKTIVLVNCRLDPEPKELFKAEPVYSISPLIAKAARSENNILGREVDTESSPTKIVLLRRFPYDWEIFLDVDGSGFELVDSAPAATVGKNGPGNEWIAGCVKKHMQFKFGQF